MGEGFAQDRALPRGLAELTLGELMLTTLAKP